jgi:predicted MFS family arabinose efflux permease
MEEKARSGLGLTLGVLLGVYILNFLDRQIVAILAEPIARDLSLNDAEIGVLTGLSFALFYTTVGLPIARYADRPKTDRVRLIAISMAVWSAMTALCGFGANFVHLLLARIGVGVGEAGCTPPAHSLITDLAPPEKRARAFAIYQLGPPVGGLIGMMLGGVLADTIGWRNTFIVVGLPGIFLAIVVTLLLRDPRHAVKTSVRSTMSPGLGTREAFRIIFASRAMRRLLVVGALASFSIFGILIWTTIYFQRSHGLTPGETGIWFGLVNGIASIGGVWLGGLIGDRERKRGAQHLLSVVAIAMILAVPFYLAAFAVADWRMSMALLFPAILLTWLYVAPYYSAVQGLVPPLARATASAVILFLQNLVGAGIGPVLLGIASDLLKPQFGDESVRTVLTVSCMVSLIAGLVLWSTRQFLPEELDKHG